MMERILTVTELTARIIKTVQDPTFKTAAVATGLCTMADQWTHKEWNPAQKAQGAIDHGDKHVHVRLHAEGCSGTEVVLRKFHASRLLCEDMAGDNNEVTFTHQVALRGPKVERLYSHLLQLCDCVALRLLKSRLRQERRQCTGLAKVGSGRPAQAATRLQLRNSGKTCYIMDAEDRAVRRVLSGTSIQESSSILWRTLNYLSEIEMLRRTPLGCSLTIFTVLGFGVTHPSSGNPKTLKQLSGFHKKFL